MRDFWVGFFVSVGFGLLGFAYARIFQHVLNQENALQIICGSLFIFIFIKMFLFIINHKGKT